MTPADLAVKVRDSNNLVDKVFTDTYGGGISAGLFADRVRPEGYDRLSAFTTSAAMQELVTEYPEGGLDSAELTINTKSYGKRVAIGRKQFINARAIKGSDFEETFSDMGREAGELLDQLWTAVLTSGPTDIFGSAFITTNKTIPGGAETLSNSMSGTGTTEDQVRADFYTMMANRASMVGANGRLYFGPRALGETYIVMFPVALTGVMERVFNTDRQTGGAQNPTFRRAILRPNPLLDATSVVDYYYFSSQPRRAPIVIVKESEGPTLQNDVDLANMALMGNNFAPRDQQADEKFTFSVHFALAAAPGSAYEVYKIDNT